MSDTWHFVTGEYPPQSGGVSDYTASVASALAAAGCRMHVWAPSIDPAPASALPGVEVHRIPGVFGDRALTEVTQALENDGEPGTLLVQYVPQAFGARGMNVGFCRWVQERARCPGADVRVMFHEPYHPFTAWPLQHNLLAVVNRLMAVLLLSDIRVAYVSTKAWERRLAHYAPRTRRFVWLPIPSTIPAAGDPARVAEWRHRLAPEAGARVVGHFGTYGTLLARTLEPALALILADRPDVHLCLIGPRGAEFAARLCAGRDEWKSRITCTGHLSPGDVAAGLKACDVALQPYPDGVSGRRTTLMAALVNGVPVVTNRGPATEEEWISDGAVAVAASLRPSALRDAVAALLDDDERQRRLGAGGFEMYDQRFALRHTVETLLSTPPGRIA